MRACGDAKVTMGASAPLLNTKTEQLSVPVDQNGGGRVGGEGWVTRLLPTFSLMKIPIHKCRDTGKSFIKHTTVYSRVKKKKSFPLSQGSDECQRFLWRLCLRAWVAGSGCGGAGEVGCETSGKRGGQSGGFRRDVLGWW